MLQKPFFLLRKSFPEHEKSFSGHGKLKFLPQKPLSGQEVWQLLPKGLLSAHKVRLSGQPKWWAGQAALFTGQQKADMKAQKWQPRDYAKVSW